MEGEDEQMEVRRGEQCVVGRRCKAMVIQDKVTQVIFRPGEAL